MQNQRHFLIPEIFGRNCGIRTKMSRFNVSESLQKIEGVQSNLKVLVGKWKRINPFSQKDSGHKTLEYSHTKLPWKFSVHVNKIQVQERTQFVEQWLGICVMSSLEHLKKSCSIDSSKKKCNETSPQKGGRSPTEKTRNDYLRFTSIFTTANTLKYYTLNMATNNIS